MAEDFASLKDIYRSMTGKVRVTQAELQNFVDRVHKARINGPRDEYGRPVTSTGKPIELDASTSGKGGKGIRSGSGPDQRIYYGVGRR